MSYLNSEETQMQQIPKKYRKGGRVKNPSLKHNKTTEKNSKEKNAQKEPYQK